MHHRWRQYRQLDYFYGKPWLFGFLYAYGGTTMLHGDLADLIRRAQEVATDSKAGSCLGMAVQPEALRHNYVVFDLLSRVGWKPEGLTLEGFLQDYATRRYGPESAPGMVACFRELTASVYGQSNVQCPLYMLRPQKQHLSPARPFGLEQAKSFLPHLARALRLALRESRRLGASPLYQHDVIDIARQYLSDLFNARVALLVKAWHAGNEKTFEHHADVLRRILSDQEKLLSSSEDFCLEPILTKAKMLPGAPADYDERIRDILTVWAGKIPDYAHRDYYELVRFYYRPRVEAFLSHARNRLGKENSIVCDEELAAIDHQIEQAWVKTPSPVATADRFADGPVRAAEEILDTWQSGR